MLLIGLTGSIGMGKSTTAGLFKDAGIPVYDSDAAVHDLYRGAAVTPVGTAFPGSVKDGTVDRAALAKLLTVAPDGFRKLEAIVHPLVRQHQNEFIERHRALGTPILLLDIPLLFETGAEDRVDIVVVVTADPEIQRQRVLARPGMSEDKFQMILSRQLPDSEKRARADYIVDTGGGLDDARRQVDAILADIKRRISSGELGHA